MTLPSKGKGLKIMLINLFENLPEKTQEKLGDWLCPKPSYGYAFTTRDIVSPLYGDKIYDAGVIIDARRAAELHFTYGLETADIQPNDVPLLQRVIGKMLGLSPVLNLRDMSICWNERG